MAVEIPYSIGFQPIADRNAQILILGSMPSVKSLDHQQYYAHPRNAFWPIMSKIFNMEEDLNYSQQCQRLIKHHIAVWDVLQSCQRQGSLDSNIDSSSMVANDFNLFFQHHPQIKYIFFNGTKAEQLFNKTVLPKLDKQYAELSMQRLPSTSPAHAAISFENKIQSWQQKLSV